MVLLAVTSPVAAAARPSRNPRVGRAHPRGRQRSRDGRAKPARRHAHRKSRPLAKPSRQAVKPAAPTSSVAVTQTSADLTQALSPRPRLRFSPTGALAGVPVINVDDTVTYQRFTGAGAAMTDSSAWLIWDELAPAARDALMRELFSVSGAHLNFLRVPMGASDYSVTGVPYTYADQPAGQSDPSLADFSVAHDEAYILPSLRAAHALNPSLYIEAVPWSPPAWMKASDALDNIDFAGTLLPQFYPTLARYFVKFLQAYAARGVNVTAIVPQNEPGAFTEYPGTQLSEQQEAGFIANDLRPALRAARLDPDLFGRDLSWGPLSAPTDPLVDQAASGAVTGLTWHCYHGSPTDMTAVHAAAPNGRQMVDECSTATGDIFSTSELLISSLRNYANAVAVWNLALDPSGGPVQPPDSGCGGCTGVVTINEQTGAYTLSPDFYQLAQLSHFVSPGAIRIASPNFVAYNLTSSYQTTITPGLDDVAFRNPDGSKVLFLYDNSATPITFDVRWDGSYVSYTIPAGATTTMDWR